MKLHGTSFCRQSGVPKAFVFMVVSYVGELRSARSLWVILSNEEAENNHRALKAQFKHWKVAGPKDIHQHQSGRGRGVDFSLGSWTPTGLVLVYIFGPRRGARQLCRCCVRLRVRPQC